MASPGQRGVSEHSTNQTGQEVLWLASAEPPAHYVSFLRSRGLTLCEPSNDRPMPAARLTMIEASTSPAARPPSLAGRRLAVMHPDPGSADALAQALRAKGAEVAALSLNPESLHRVEALDPDVVIMEAADFTGSCWEIVRKLWQHPRLRFATVLLATPELMGSERVSALDVHDLSFAVHRLAEDYEGVRLAAQKGEPVTLSLATLGPARTLRALLESGSSLRARFVTSECDLEVDVAEKIIVGAQSQPALGQEPLLGVHALALLMTQRSGSVQLRRVDHPAQTNVMAPLDTALHMAREVSPPRPSGLRWVPVANQNTSQASATAKPIAPSPHNRTLIGIPAVKVDASIALDAQPARSEPRKEAQPVTRSEPRKEAQPVTRSEPRKEAQPVTRSEPRKEARPVTRSEPGKEAQPVTRSEPRQAQLAEREPTSDKEPTSTGPAPLAKAAAPVTVMPPAPRISIGPAKTARATFTREQPSSGLAEASPAGKVASVRPAAPASARAAEGALRPEPARLASVAPPPSRAASVLPPAPVNLTSAVAQTVSAAPPAAQPVSVVAADTPLPDLQSFRAPRASVADAGSIAETLEPSTMARLPELAEVAPSLLERLRTRLQPAHLKLAALGLGVLLVLGLATWLLGSPSTPQVVAAAPSSPPRVAARAAPPPAAPVQAPASAFSPTASEEELTGDDEPPSRRASELVSQGHAFRRKHMIPTARSRYLEALRECPGYPRALAGMARLSLDAGDSAQAIQYARQLVRVRSGQAGYHVLLGDALKAAGQAAQARAAFETAARMGSRVAKQRLAAK